MRLDPGIAGAGPPPVISGPAHGAVDSAAAANSDDSGELRGRHAGDPGRS